MAKKKAAKDEPWRDDLLGYSKGSSKIMPRCYESHPPYEIVEGVFIYGGSCSYPIVKDADVYGGFDAGMRFSGGKYPWSNEAGGPVEFLFSISDMRAPKDPAEFRKMIEWLAEQLLAGKKVHLGCIGGHGRTGMVLAALRKHMADDADAITHVRQHYCKKVVETSEQTAWLEKHWGIKPVAGSKQFGYGSSVHKGSGSRTTSHGGLSFTEMNGGTNLLTLPTHSDDWSRRKDVQSTGQPLRSEGSIWGPESNSTA